MRLEIKIKPLGSGFCLGIEIRAFGLGSRVRIGHWRLVFEDS